MANHVNLFYFVHTIWLVYGLILAEYVLKNKLRFVRIFFGTPTFDRIVKDRAAKFEDMLAAIGGTMGLLTGFSIISAVEIIYFATKLIFGVFKKKTRPRLVKKHP